MYPGTSSSTAEIVVRRQLRVCGTDTKFTYFYVVHKRNKQDLHAYCLYIQRALYRPIQGGSNEFPIYICRRADTGTDHLRTP